MRILLPALISLAGSVLAQAPKDPLGLGPLAQDRPANSKTEITAQKEATFSDADNTAVFLGNVRVNDASFLLSSDKLTVKLTPDRSGIERAVAEGHVVIVQQTRTDEASKAATGRGERAEYIPSKGTITLSGSPEIQQGINRHIATSPGTRMTFNRDGRATTDGPSRTVITDTSSAPALR